tara:strand:- start:3190 stop:3441 length:252 start_codon:yes stop_codon:yes gene_type:complete
MKITETIVYKDSTYTIINHTENMKENNQKYISSFNGKKFVPKFEVDLESKNELSSGAITIGLSTPIGYFDTRKECIKFIEEKK